MRFNLPPSLRLGASSTAIAALIALGTGGLALVAQAATDSGDISATVVRPITIADTAALRFGTFSTPAAGGATVTISTAGARSFGNGGLGVASTVGQATFNVAGEGSLVYTISLPGSAVTIITGDGVAANKQISVGTFLSNPNATGTLSGNLGEGGNQTLNVGATATTAAGQVPGPYTGTFAVTVEYQ